MNYHTANFYVDQTLFDKYSLILQMYVKCRLELTKSTYQQVGPPLVASGQQLIPVISSYYQQLSAVGKSGGGKLGRKGGYPLG